MIGYPLRLAHDVLHNKYLDDDNDDDTKTSHTVFAIQLLDFHTKTLIHLNNR